jgi:hypothetical protein
VSVWVSIDGGNEARAQRVCYLAYWRDDQLDYLAASNIQDLSQYGIVQPSSVVVERPQFDGRIMRGQTTPAVMLGLAWNTAAVAYSLARGSAPVSEYTPNEWIGGVSKAILHRRIFGKLSASERAAVAEYARGDVDAAIKKNLVRAAKGKPPLKHPWYNVLDAVGVGLYHLGRTRKGAA